MALPLQIHSAVPQALRRNSQPGAWSYRSMQGRLCELSSPSGAGLLTAAFRLVLDAQCEGEPVAWIAAGSDLFFAPDVAETGVDVEALAVVRLPDTVSAARAADRLLRSGGFGLIVLDLCAAAPAPEFLQSRLLQSAQAHGAAVVCLTAKPTATLPTLAVCGQTSCVRRSGDIFNYRIEIKQDNLNGAGWRHQEDCRGPSGLH